MTGTLTPARTPARTPVRTPNAAIGGDRLHDLVARIAAGDRPAFRRLYAFLAVRVWRDTIRAMPNSVDARAVTRSTFVEVWHLAGHHADDPRLDTRAWVATITARRVDDRLRVPDPSCLRGYQDRRTHLELVALLGAGHATVRTRPAAFAGVDDLDLTP